MEQRTRTLMKIWPHSTTLLLRSNDLILPMVHSFAYFGTFSAPHRTRKAALFSRLDLINRSWLDRTLPTGYVHGRIARITSIIRPVD